MSKLISFFAIILIIFSIFISFYGVAYASDIDMNLVANETLDEATGDENVLADENIVTDDTLDQQSSTTEDIISPTGVSATVEEGLGLTNILNILLITVGVILILLSIAIIIRLK